LLQSGSHGGLLCWFCSFSSAAWLLHGWSPSSAAAFEWAALAGSLTVASQKQFQTPDSEFLTFL